MIRFFYLLIFLVLINLSCSASQERQFDPSRKFALHRITFYLPAHWHDTPDKYFELKSIGITPNLLPGWIEYKSSDSKFADETSKQNYAAGWFEAVARNYPDWKFDYKRQSAEELETYEFEGTYRVASDVYRKIGKLKFRKDKVHAIYYTGYDIDFESTRALFLEMDSKIEFHSNE